MTHLDIELKQLKDDMLEMFQLNLNQMEKAQKALLNYDQNLAREILVHEKRINAFELKLDRDCENIIALFNPVAVDLRFVLASLKINSNLERIGDIAEGIAYFVLDIRSKLLDELIESSNLKEMFQTGIEMMSVAKDAFNNENSDLARIIFAKDERMDEINRAANSCVGDFIKKYPERMNQSLYLLSSIRKLERVGDQTKNIAEEIIFFIEAKVLKHGRKDK